MRLSVEQIIQFQTEGYLVVENALTEGDLQPVIDELAAYVDRRAKELKAEGKIQDLCEDQPFEARFVSLYEQSRHIGKGLDIMELRGKAMFEFLKNDNLLDVVECLLGSELMCNPIQHVRAKVPMRKTNGESDYFQNVPWHQDAGVTLEEADPSEIITFWLPLIDATAETGCMEVMPGVFKRGLLQHISEGGTTIAPDLLPQVPPQLVPCPKGGIVIMHKYTPHRGTSNVSDKVRWSVDLRYHKTGASSGRPHHPSFVARSKANPGAVLEDHQQWCELWEDALTHSKGEKSHRV